jgi:hypothetical protein
MLAKITAKNQLTLPKSMTQAVGATEYFEVEARAGQIILTPVRMAELGLVDADMAQAVAWSRVQAHNPLLAAEPVAPYTVKRTPGKKAQSKA